MCNFFIDKKPWEKRAYVRCKTHVGYANATNSKEPRFCPSFDGNKYVCPVGGDTILKQELLEKEGYGVLHGSI
jgi:hypothetical protein